MNVSKRLARGGGSYAAWQRQWPPPTETFDSAAGEARYDGWENWSTGIGSGLDKSQHGRFFPVNRLLDQELTSLFSGSDLAAKGIESRPKEMFREGFEATADEVKESEAKDVLEYLEENFDLEHQLVDAIVWSRLYGGGLLILGIEDGGLPWEPVRESAIQSIDWMSFVSRRYAFVQSQYSSLDAPNGKYGRPEIYLVANAVAGTGWDRFGAVAKRSPEDLSRSGATISLVHESRCIRFDGNRTDVITRQQLAGWDWSVLQRVYDAMRQFEHSFDSVGYLLSDAAQAVYKLQGLMKAISAGNRTQVMQRAMLMEQTRSVMRGVLLDAGDKDGKNAEDFKREPTPFTGIPDILQVMMLRLSAAFDMPVTKLFGRAPAGLNATGEADIRTWYDTIRIEAKTEMSPRVRKILRYVGLSKRGPLRGRDVKWHVGWKPLWSPTDEEVAKVQYANAQRDDLYIQNETVRPEEVACTLADVYPDLDIESREAALNKGESFEPYENDPEPPQFGEPPPPGNVVPQIGAPAGKGQPGNPPLKGRPKSGAAAASGPKGDARYAQDRIDSNFIAHAVYDQLLQDYAPEDIGWVKAARWKGPMRVSLAKIDFTNRERWSASQDPVKIRSHAVKIAQGIEKPIILVKTPSSKLLADIDGHHRLLAYEGLKKNPRAYVAYVDADHGPWENMHAQQKETGLEASTQSQK